MAELCLRFDWNAFLKPSYTDNNKTNKCPKNIFTAVPTIRKWNKYILRELKNLKHTRKNTAPRRYSCGCYRSTPTMRNKILNYEEIVQSIIVDNKISFSERSEVRDEHSGYIKTGALWLTTKTRIRSVLSKVPNYRKPATTSFSNCNIAIDSSVYNCFEKCKTERKLTGNDLSDWKDFLSSN